MYPTGFDMTFSEINKLEKSEFLSVAAVRQLVLTAAYVNGTIHESSYQD